MSYAENRERGHVPTEEDLDPFDLAVQRLAGLDPFWAYMESSFDVDTPWGEREEIDDIVVRALLAHLIKNADYEGLKVAMVATFTPIAQAELEGIRMAEENAVRLEIRAAQMRNPCGVCGVPAHAPCTQNGAHGPVTMSRPHKRRSAA